MNCFTLTRASVKNATLFLVTVLIDGRATSQYCLQRQTIGLSNVLRLVVDKHGSITSQFTGVPVNTATNRERDLVLRSTRLAPIHTKDGWRLLDAHRIVLGKKTWLTHLHWHDRSRDTGTSRWQRVQPISQKGTPFWIHSQTICATWLTWLQQKDQSALSLFWEGKNWLCLLV